MPWFLSPVFEDELQGRDLGPEDEDRVRRYREDGFLVLEGLFDDRLVDRIVEESRPHFRAEIAEGERSRGRVQDVWDECPAVREMACHPEVMRLLELLYDRRPIPFQTLNFRYGTEQRAHQDRMFFSSLPRDYMCGVWVALEDVSSENGAVFYHPGSHRFPHLSYEDLGLGFRNLNSETEVDHDARRTAYEDHLDELLGAAGMESVTLDAPRGTTLIWAAGLAHGGAPIERPGSTRWSQVTHYFFEGCLYTTPIYSNEWLGDIYLRHVHDIASDETVSHRYLGLELGPVEESGVVKVVIDHDGERDVLRTVRNEDIGRGAAHVNETLRQNVRDLRQVVEMLKSSPSYRLGRALTAPLRLVRRILGTR